MRFDVCGIDFLVEIDNCGLRNKVLQSCSNIITDPNYSEDDALPGNRHVGEGVDARDVFDILRRRESFTYQSQNGDFGFQFDSPSNRFSFFSKQETDETFNKIVHILYRHLYYSLIAEGGVLLHASGIDMHGCGLVFLGHSGIGKTTVLKKFAPDLRFSDELLCVRPAKGQKGFEMYGFPWPRLSEKARDRSVPLGNIFFLIRKGTNAIQAKDVKSSFRELMRHMYILPRGNDEVLKTMNRLIEICLQVGCYDMSFTLDADVESAMGVFLEREKHGLS